jgi:Predicted transcriptional regulators
MTIKFGEKLKSLRKQHKITQDKLATAVGVTSQAVSRWEQAICYPDVEMFPAIANFFGVTIDELFLSDSRSKRQKELSEKIYRTGANGYVDEAIQLARETLTEFPNNFEIIYELKNQLFYKDPIANRDEILSLGERILDDCSDDTLRHGTIQTMALTYFKSGDEINAKKMIQKLPSMYCTETVMMPNITSGDERIHATMMKIFESGEVLSTAISNFAEFVKPTEKIRIYQKAIQVLDLIYDDGNYGFYNHRIAYRYVDMAECYLELNEHDNALDCMEKAAEHTITFEKCVGDESNFTAVLVSKIPNPPDYHHSKPTTMSYDLVHDYFMAKDIYKPIRDTERFKAVINKLTGIRAF